MEAVKQNRTFRTEEKTGGKSKTRRKYKDDIRTAYDIGYTRVGTTLMISPIV